MDFQRKLNLDPRIIEKDYVLGWLLAGIENDRELFKSWVFKGGTCLKKCYFENYRFSEDLDYTLTDNTHISQAFLLRKFKEITVWIYEEAGIEFQTDKIQFEIYKNISDKVSVEGRIAYTGPLQRQGSPYSCLAKVVFPHRRGPVMTAIFFSKASLMSTFRYRFIRLHQLTFQISQDFIVHISQNSQN